MRRIYAKFSDSSDVYVVMSNYGTLECLSDGFATTNRLSMLSHLENHIGNGDKVPWRTLETIENEAMVHGPNVDMIAIHENPNKIAKKTA